MPDRNADDVRFDTPPGHIFPGVAVALTPCGFAVTVTVTPVDVAVHPTASVPVTVYVVVPVGLADTGVPVVGVSPVAGLHE